MKQKILLLDVETAFRIAAVWNRWNVNVSMSQLIQDTHVLTWVAKWYGSDELIVDSLHYHPGHYKKDPTCDKLIIQEMWKLLDEADICVGHNLDSFDIKRLNTQFIKHGMQPPSPYHTVDTYKIAKRAFNFTSNRLGDLGEFLGLGGKMDNDGQELWNDVVLRHDRKAFDRMVAYNERDVELLEDVYNALKPWDKRHPSIVGLAEPGKPQCNVCGSTKIVKNGSYATNTGRIYQKYKCADCGHNQRAPKVTPIPKDKQQQLRSM